MSSDRSSEAVSSWMRVPGQLLQFEVGSTRFMVWHSGADSARDPDGMIELVMEGECYEGAGSGSATALLEAYRNSGPDFVRHLNGSFSLMVLDRRDGILLVATDRLNSRKVYMRRNGDAVAFSSRIEFLLGGEVTLDFAAVSCFLANGAIHRNRTSFNEVRIVERASIYTCRAGEVNRREYWQYRFNNAYAGRDTKALQTEMQDLLVHAVRIRLPQDSTPWMSLSAGYDSRSILGILASRLKAPQVCCFSYAFGPTTATSDEVLARHTAELYGYSFRVIPSYSGHLPTMLSRNADLGQGTSHVCHEVDAWFAIGSLPEASGRPRLFVGDECMGWRNRPVRSWADLLQLISIQNFSVVSWLERYLGGAAVNAFAEALEKERTAICESCPDFDDWHDRKDYLYLEERLAHVIMPWRENFPGRFFQVGNPLLDYHILDFLQKIPSVHRRGKRLFSQTVRWMLPDLFGIERAFTSSFLSYLDSAVMEYKAELMNWLAGTQSPLDSIVPKEALIAILKDYQKSAPAGGMRSRLRNKFKEWFRETSIYSYAQGVMRLPPPPRVSVSIFITRVLALRLFLARQASLSLRSPHLVAAFR